MKKENIKPFLISIACIIALSVASFYNWKNFEKNLKDVKNNGFSEINNLTQNISLNLDTENKPLKNCILNNDLSISYPENWTDTSKDLLNSFKNAETQDAELLLLVNSYSINSTPIFLVVEKINEETFNKLIKKEDSNIDIFNSGIKDNYYFIESKEKKENTSVSVYSKARVYPTKNGIYYISLIGILEAWKEENNIITEDILNSAQINSEIIFTEEEINALISSLEETIF